MDYKQSDYKATANCSFCNKFFDKYAVSCDHIKACTDCEDLFFYNCDTADDRTYYSQCIYCIMDGNDWDEEWDDWREISGRVMKLYNQGCSDALIHSFPYECATFEENLEKNLKDGKISHCAKNNIIAFKDVYLDGFNSQQKRRKIEGKVEEGMEFSLREMKDELDFYKNFAEKICDFKIYRAGVLVYDCEYCKKPFINTEWGYREGFECQEGCEKFTCFTCEPREENDWICRFCEKNCNLILRNQSNSSDDE